MQSQPNAAHRRQSSPFARLLAPSQPATAANDNGHPAVSDAMFEAALRHFAAHGLGAARIARQQAEAAFFAGDRTAYQWWLGVCRLLDRRMARIAERGCDATGPGGCN